MNSTEFREFAKAAIDFVADYLDNIRDRPVIPSVEPGYLLKLLPEKAPEEPEHWKDFMSDVNNHIMPGITNWQSPYFHAYYPTATSFESIAANIISDGLGIVGFSWVTSPACTELEVVTLNWLAQLLGLPECFMRNKSGSGGGVIQGSASEATLVCLLAAKERMVRRMLEIDPDADEGDIKKRLIAYASDQSNSSVEKAGIIGSMKMRLLPTNENCSLRVETLRRAFAEDRAKGLIPCYFVATLGTTVTCSYDDILGAGPLCQEEGVWMHIDAAYAGTAFVCPEYRHLMEGVENAESFNVNPHKWMLVTFDCSTLWVKNDLDLIKAFDVQRIYLTDTNTNVIPEYRHWQLPLGRRFRALKLWSVLRLYGAEGLRKHVRTQVGLAQKFARLVRADSRFEIVPEPSMGLVCFRFKGCDELTKKLLNNITQRKKLYIIAGSYHGQFIIRFVVCGRSTTDSDIEISWREICEQADVLSPRLKNGLKDTPTLNIENIKLLGEKNQ